MDKKEIDELLFDLTDLGHRIKKVDQLVASLKSPALKAQYEQELVYMIEMYRQMGSIARDEVEKYCNWEKSSGGPISIGYRRVLKSLSSY